MEAFDIAIVGAGPIGIELAVALKKQGISYVHFEAGQVGGTIEWYAPQTVFFSSSDRIAIAGVPLLNNSQAKATREEYLTYLRGVVTQFDLAIRTNERVTEINREKDTGFIVRTARSLAAVGSPQEEKQTVSEQPVSLVRVQKVVLAIGDMHRPNRLDIPGEDLAHVSHYLADPHKYFRKNVCIIGGKNSAVEAAIRLQRAGANVTLSYRGRKLDSSRIKFWLFPELKSHIARGLIQYVPESVPKRITNAGVELAVGSKGETCLLDADYVLLLTGYRQDVTLFEQLGVTLSGEGSVPSHSKETMETNIPGVFVAGTACAGTQIGGVTEYIETSHIHVDRIIAAHLGRAAPEETKKPEEYEVES